ncbi:uncharacterized protein METZ01_LOCUS143923 [marine metagenome]|uniref:Uncharacterized protein n=1 Tax=marine metagenome TaxID=408172 RepID=A0A381ZPA7_9ZZZZ
MAQGVKKHPRLFLNRETRISLGNNKPIIFLLLFTDNPHRGICLILPHDISGGSAKGRNLIGWEVVAVSQRAGHPAIFKCIHAKNRKTSIQ